MFSPDGAKIAIIQSGQVTVAFLGLRGAARQAFRIEMKRKIEDFPDSDALKKALADKKLCDPPTR